jgi:hypothetical protein
VQQGGHVVYVGRNASIKLSRVEAHRFLLLDPYFVQGQGAVADPTRSKQVESVAYGAQFGERSRPISLNLTQTMGETSDTSGTATTTLSVTHAWGSQSSFNFGESIFGVLGGTVTQGQSEQRTETAEIRGTFSQANSVNQTSSTVAQVTLNDVDVTSGCAMPACHLPLPVRPSVNVYVDKMFGGFMFQDPGAPPPTPLGDNPSAAMMQRVSEVAADFASGASRGAEQVAPHYQPSARDLAHQPSEVIGGRGQNQ